MENATQKTVRLLALVQTVLRVTHVIINVQMAAPATGNA